MSTINKITFTWEKIKSYKNPDGSSMDVKMATKEWFEENIKPILEDLKVESSEAGTSFSRSEFENYTDIYELLGQEDQKLVKLIKGLHEAVANIKKYNGRAFARITRLYSLNGFVRTNEIHYIITDTISNTFAFLSDDGQHIEDKMNEYFDAEINLIIHVHKLRLWIYGESINFDYLFDLDAKGMIANRIYRILSVIFNVTLYGNQINNLNSIVVSLGSSNLFEILNGMRVEERVALIEVDPYVDEDYFNEVDIDSKIKVSSNSNVASTEINERFYEYVDSMSQDDLRIKVINCYNTYKGSSNLVPIMGEFGSVEFVDLILLMNYFKKLIDEENNFELREFYKDLNLKCLITMGFAFNHMSPDEFSDELDKIIKPNPVIMEYSEWSKVYRYLRDNYGDWIHNQEFAYGTPELRKDGGGETQLKYDRHYKEFVEVYNELVDYDLVIRFYKSQGLKPVMCET